jgi:acetyl esterase/lipase
VPLAFPRRLALRGRRDPVHPARPAIALLAVVAAFAVSAGFGADPAGARPRPNASAPTATATITGTATVTDAGLVTESYVAGVGAWHTQSLTVNAWLGTYRLAHEGSPTVALATTAPACLAPGAPAGPCAANSVEAALRAIGVAATVTDGPDGSLVPMARYTITFDAPDPAPLTVVDPALFPAGSAAVVDCVFCLDTEAGPLTNANGAAVIYAHGGGFIGGDRGDDAWAASRARFEAAGYRTFSINYRLLNPSAAMFGPAPFGEGCDWTAPVKNVTCTTWLAAAENATADVNQSVAWLRSVAASRAIDPARLAVLGSSAGAIAALNNHYGSGPSAGRPAATVSLSGIMDTARQSATAGPVLLITYAGADPVYGGQFLTGIDSRQRNEDILRTARQTGNKVHLRSYPGVGHDFSPASPYYDDVMRTTLAFLDENLRSPALSTTLGGTWLSRPSGFTLGQGQSAGHAGPDAPRALRGDFNGDGRDDVIWQGPDGLGDMIWYGSDAGVWLDPKEWDGDASTFVPAITVPAAHTGTVADVNGDGRSDVVWYDAATGGTELWSGRSGVGFDTVTLAPLATHLVITAADVDGDGHADLVAHRAEDHSAVVLRATGQPDAPFELIAQRDDVVAGARAIVGDFDGNGADEVHWQNQPTDARWTFDGSTASVGSDPLVGASSVATVGDLDGDGADDIIWYDPTTGAGTQIWKGLQTGGFAVLNLGTAPVGFQWFFEDIDGDGHDDLIAFAAVYRGVAIFHNNGTGGMTLAFVNTNLPAAVRGPFFADVDGDGRTDLAFPF